jgi:flagellar motor component MotA
MGDDKDEEAKKSGLLYLEESLKHKDEFIQKTLDNLPENATKEELGTAVKD